MANFESLYLPYLRTQSPRKCLLRRLTARVCRYNRGFDDVTPQRVTSSNSIVGTRKCIGTLSVGRLMLCQSVIVKF